MAGRKRKHWKKLQAMAMHDHQASGNDSDKDDEGSNLESSLNVEVDSIQYKILNAKHPFELAHMVEAKQMTPSQRAITCCIQMNGGWAREDVLLNFLQEHWGFIGKMNSKLPNNMPDSRVLHINLAVRKKGNNLFVQNPENGELWGLNHVEDLKTRNPRYKGVGRDLRLKRSESQSHDSSGHSDDESSEAERLSTSSNSPANGNRAEEPRIKYFEDRIVDILRDKPNGLLLKDIIELSKPLEGQEGLFNQLPHDRRVRACLITKKELSEVYHRNEYWSCFESHEPTSRFDHTFSASILPDSLKGVKVADITVDQLWSMLKEKKIYT